MNSLRILNIFITKYSQRIYSNYFISNLLNKQLFSSEIKSSLDTVKLFSNPFLQKYIENLTKEASENDKKLLEYQPILSLWEKRVNFIEDMNGLQNILTDGSNKELQSLAQDEEIELKRKIEEVEDEILDQLVPIDETSHDENSLILEVSAGVGGQEAMLFAAELLEMYQNYVDFRGWEQDSAEIDCTELGGVRHGTLSIQGIGCFNELKFEGGVHRVQRVPKTEKNNRLHTSTVTVAILPQPSEIDVILEAKDLKIETKRSGGAGGQHVNTTDSCVRITHLPTNITVECQTERSQVKNKKKAMSWLTAKLYKMQLEKQQSDTRGTRKKQVGLSLRSEKIRTYNYPQDRITDHRIGFTSHNLREFIKGNEYLYDMINKLQQHEKYIKITDFIDNLYKK